jgi:AraC-like DNA-binding protein
MAVGELPRDFVTLGLLLHRESESGACDGRRLSPEDVLVIPEATDLHVRLQPGTEWVSVQVRRAAFEAMGIELPSIASAVYRIEAIDRGVVHSAIADVTEAFGPRQVGATSAQTVEWCHAELVHAFARVIGAAQPSAVRGGAERRRILSRVEEFLSLDTLSPLRMDAVCDAAGTTLRTLERTFQEALGVSPKRYFSLRRLADARAALLEAAARRDPNASVTDIATASGFFHLGRFATDYKAAYGESPSETLKGRG